MRGKVVQRSMFAAYLGITPAHAGKSSACLISSPARWDHPRPCGEKRGRPRALLHLPGSPPPMRGKGARFRLPVNVVGITPAHAGKSFACFVLQIVTRDHPRPCGEKTRAKLPEMFVEGSPPPMRGKGAYIRYAQGVVRITPAHAGKSSIRQAARPGAVDHPRPCGEKSPTTILVSVKSGSPPPMRGKERAQKYHAQRRGITPAHAGKSPSTSFSRAASRDHPRPCGEK